MTPAGRLWTVAGAILASWAIVAFVILALVKLAEYLAAVL